MRILYLERRGCEFDAKRDPALAAESDIGNYRLCTPGYDVHGKDGRDYFLEFTRYNKRGGNSKTQKPRVVLQNALHVDTAYETDDGCFRNLEMESDLNSMPLKFTSKDILAAVNKISAEPYDAIKYVCAFDEVVTPQENPTPRDLMLRYAKRNRISTDTDHFGKLHLKLYSGLYVYDHWRIRKQDENEVITVYLARI